MRKAKATQGYSVNPEENCITSILTSVTLKNESAKVYERNPVDDQSFEYKPVGKTIFDSSIYKENYTKITENRPWK